MRDTYLHEFLARNDLKTCQRNALAGDASSRRYERLMSDDRTYILMDAPPPETIDQFVTVAALLKDRGYSPPEVIDQDSEFGFLLLEDLGDGLLAGLIASGLAERPYYELAVDFLIDLSRQPAPSSLPGFSADYIRSQNEMFLDWYVKDQADSHMSGTDIALFADIWEELIPSIFIAPDVMLLRDFHAENLLYLEGRKGVQALGLLDFQDALQGPPAYDLVSLLQDARRDVSEALERDMLSRYLQATGLDCEAFKLSYAILGAHRAMRILGIFTRLAKDKGKPGYLELIPRVRSHLARNFARPELAALKNWTVKILGEKGLAS
jgi:aminoglycoside/choline kinase family phosphotransferase